VFEVGFTELLLIFALALVVLGPERLPKVASQVGRWVGRARAMARQFREQLEEEANLEESRTPPPATPPPSASPVATPEPPSSAPPVEPPVNFVPGDDDFRHNDTPDHALPEAQPPKPSDERGS